MQQLECEVGGLQIFLFLFLSFDLIRLLDGLLVAYFEYFLCAALNFKKEKNIKTAISAMHFVMLSVIVLFV